MPGVIDDILKKFRESFIKNNTNESEQKQWDAILEYHASLQKSTDELIDFVSGKDVLEIHKSIENLIDSLVQINKAMNSYKRSLQVAPNQNPDKYIKEYIARTEEVLSKQITHAKQEVLEVITSQNEDQFKGMMRIFNLMVKVHSQIRAESTKSYEPKVQVEQNRHLDKSAVKPKKYSRRKYNKIQEQMKESENELEMTLNLSDDVNTLEEGKKQITDMIKEVNKLIKQTDAQSRMEDKTAYKFDLLKLRDLFTERLASLNALEERYTEELKTPKKVKSSLLEDAKIMEEIDSLLYPSTNPTHNKTSNEQSTSPTLNAALHKTPATDNKTADSPTHGSSPRPHR